MLNTAITGILAGTGWLIGFFLFKYTKEEISWIAKKVNKKYRYWVIFSAITGLALFNYSPFTLNFESRAILIFTISLLLSSLYGIKQKFKHHIIFFLTHTIIFLLIYYISQHF